MGPKTANLGLWGRWGGGGEGIWGGEKRERKAEIWGENPPKRGRKRGKWGKKGEIGGRGWKRCDFGAKSWDLGTKMGILG